MVAAGKRKERKETIDERKGGRCLLEGRLGGGEAGKKGEWRVVERVGREVGEVL
jgi:hypothetical protein